MVLNVKFVWLTVQQFDQVVLAYGAESDRALGIPGEVCLIRTRVWLVVVSLVCQCSVGLLSLKISYAESWV